MLEPIFERLATVPGVVFALIGAFYVFAGWFAAKQFLLEVILDASIAAIGGGKPDREERIRLFWLLGGCILTFTAGAALVLQSSLAVWLFLAGLAQQALHLLYLAPRYFDRDEPPSPAGRQKTINAAILFGIITASVVWAGLRGYLLPVTGIGALSSIATAVIGIGFAGWVAMNSRLRTGGDSSASEEMEEIDAADYERDVDPDAIASIEVVVEMYSWPLLARFDDGYSRYCEPADAGLSGELSAEINAWQERFDALGNDIWPEEETRAHVARAEEFARRIRDELDATGRGHIAVSYRDFEGETRPLG